MIPFDELLADKMSKLRTQDCRSISVSGMPTSIITAQPSVCKLLPQWAFPRTDPLVSHKTRSMSESP